MIIRAENEKIPLHEGVLIFDEVKVIDKQLLYSKTHTYISIAMSKVDYANIAGIMQSLNKIFQSRDCNPKTNL